MATIAFFTPLTAEFPDDPPPFLSMDGQGRLFLGFNDTTSESCVFTFVAPSSIDVGGDQTVNIYWRADTATTNDVVWQAEVEAISPDDALDSDASSSYATGQTVTDTAPGTAGYITRAQITLTVAQADSIAANDLVRLRISRLPANANDDMVGDAEILAVEWDDNAT